jgi:hypothetical protein
MRQLMKRFMVGVIISIAWLLMVGSATQVCIAEVGNTGANVGRTMVDGLIQDSSTVADTALPPLPAPGPHVYHRTYGGSDFHTTNSDLTYSAYGMSIYATAIPGGGFSLRQVLDLPDGAQITRIDFYVIDNDSTSHMTMQLYRSTPSTASQISLATISTTVHSPDVQTLSITGSPIATLSTSASTYALRYAPVITGMTHLLVGAHVEYTLPIIYLPTTQIE